MTLVTLNLPSQTAARLKLGIGSLFLPLFGLASSTQQVVGAAEDAMVPRRGLEYGSHVTETVVNQILTEMDGIERLEGVIVLGATNRPDMLDPSLLRPGRFDRLVLVTRPDREAREEILKVHAKAMPLRGVSIEELSKKTEGYSGADLESLCREAAMNAMREDVETRSVDARHFEAALREVKPSVTDDEAKTYEKGFKRGKRDEKIPAYM